jgi:hypothetical protein
MRVQRYFIFELEEALARHCEVHQLSRIVFDLLLEARYSLEDIKTLSSQLDWEIEKESLCLGQVFDSEDTK